MLGKLVEDIKKDQVDKHFGMEGVLEGYQELSQVSVKYVDLVNFQGLHLDFAGSKDLYGLDPQKSPIYLVQFLVIDPKFSEIAKLKRLRSEHLRLNLYLIHEIFEFERDLVNFGQFCTNLVQLRKEDQRPGTQNSRDSAQHPVAGLRHLQTEARLRYSVQLS